MVLASDAPPAPPAASLVREAGTRSPESLEADTEMVGVVVATRNRAPLLERLLETLLRQTVAPGQVELTIVDDASADGSTAEVVERFANRFAHVRLLRFDRCQGHANAANLGARASRALRVLFIDDDCVPDAAWIERMRETLRRAPIAAGSVDSPRAPFLTLCHNLASFHAVAPGLPAGPILFVAGGNLGVTRGAFAELGGFEPDRRVGHDMEFALRARERGIPIRFCPEARVVHRPDYVRGASLVERAYRYARTTVRLRRRFRRLLRTPLVLRSAPLLLLASPAIALARTVTAYARNPTLRAHPETAPVFFLLKLAWCLGAARGLRDRHRERATP
jgi:GT2 family glycosyltransferase